MTDYMTTEHISNGTFLADGNLLGDTGVPTGSIKITPVADVRYTPDGTATVYSLEGTSAAASATIGSGDNGAVTVTALTKGVVGNGATGGFSIEVVLGSGESQPLTATMDDGAILVTLATDENGDPDAAANTAALVADAINGIENSGVDADASGTGATALTAAEGPTNFAGGVDGSEIVIELTPGAWNDLQFILMGNTTGYCAVRFRTAANNQMADMTNLNYAFWHKEKCPVWLCADDALYAYISLFAADGSAVAAGVAGSIVTHTIRTQG
jgi:hypothetical protein